MVRNTSRTLNTLIIYISSSHTATIPTDYSYTYV